MGRLLQLLIMFGPMIMRAYSQYQRQQGRNSRQQPGRGGATTRRQDGRYVDHRRQRPAAPNNSKLKQSGVAKYKEYDYKGAIEDFNKAIEINPNDAAAHFNIACAYSLIEDATKSMIHLDQAVVNGYKNLDSIETHDGLAYLRVQKKFEKFRANGYRLFKKGK